MQADRDLQFHGAEPGGILPIGPSTTLERQGMRRHAERHFSDRTGWLRAAVLGANDGLLSTASLLVGVAAAAASSGSVLVAGLAAVVAGAMSMAAGEYVSVSSQADSEAADLDRERAELASDPVGELDELSAILQARGLTEATARVAAREMSAHDPLAAHAREELGLTDTHAARPLQAAFASALAFVAGGLPPLLVALAMPTEALTWGVVGTTLALLLGLGGLGARFGGAPAVRGALRVAFWGVIAMGATYGVGSLVGARL